MDGILCLADILTDTSHSEATHAEAAAVIAQITSPHLTFTQHLSSFLENMEEIVTALVSKFSTGLLSPVKVTGWSMSLTLKNIPEIMFTILPLTDKIAILNSEPEISAIA